MPDPRRWWTLAVLCLSLLVIGLDNTILNVALPTLQRDLDASSSQLQWIVDVYMLVFAGVLLTAGSLGDRFGRKRALTFGLAVFGLGSLGSALATSPELLIAMRGADGRRRRVHHALDAVDPDRDLPGAGARQGDRDLGRLLRHRDRDRPGHGRLADRARRLELDLPRQPARGAARAARGALPRPREPRRVRAAAGPARLPALLRRADHADLGPDRGARARLDRRARARRVRRRRGRARRLRRLGAARAVADARHRALPQPALQRLQRRDLARLLRPLRDDLPAHAVPAAGPRLHGARGRPADDAGRRRADRRRAAVGQARRAARASAWSSRPG